MNSHDTGTRRPWHAHPFTIMKPDLSRLGAAADLVSTLALSLVGSLLANYLAEAGCKRAYWQGAHCAKEEHSLARRGRTRRTRTRKLTRTREARRGSRRAGVVMFALRGIRAALWEMEREKSRKDRARSLSGVVLWPNSGLTNTTTTASGITSQLADSKCVFYYD